MNKREKRVRLALDIILGVMPPTLSVEDLLLLGYSEKVAYNKTFSDPEIYAKAKDVIVECLIERKWLM